MRWIVAATCVALSFPLAGAIAQNRDQTLADIRQELTVLYVDLQRLKRELSTTGAPSGTSNGSILSRVDAIEAQMRSLTSKTEQLEFRINAVAKDGGNRIGDLEFRLCELEAKCDIAALGNGTTLGGALSEESVNPTVGVTASPELAIGEEADFERADAAMNSGDYASAQTLLEEFLATYPGSPLTALAHLMRGDALNEQGNKTGSARAYLEAFSTDPQGDSAADALFKLGTALGSLGQTSEACVTLSEVAVRFPSADAVSLAEAERAKLSCS